MSGHSKWAGIKHQKAITDQKRAKVFSKLLATISVAAKSEPNPNFNPRLRSAIEKAKGAQVPSDNIERAIKKASEAGHVMDELLMESYGPGGVAILIEVATDNRNRTVSEVKKIISELGGKWAEPGSVQWGFEKTQDGWQSKFPQEISAQDRPGLMALVEALEGHDDVQRVYMNCK